MTDPYHAPEQLVAEYDAASGIYLLTSWAPGPACLAVADLGAGVEVAVDYTRPATLASITIEGGPHLHPQVAEFLDGFAGYGTSSMLRELASSPGRPQLLHQERRRRPQRGRGNDITDAIGNVALLHEALAVQGMTPLHRVAALLEMASYLRRVPLPDHGLLGRVVTAAAAVADDAAPPPAHVAWRVAELAREAAALADAIARRRLSRYADRCEQAEHPAVAAMAAPAAARAHPMAARRPTPDRDARRRAAGRDEVSVSFPHPAVARVAVERGRLVDGRWWTRVFRRSDGLVLGMAPLRPGGSSHVLVPPQLGDEELAVDVTTEPMEAPRSRESALILEAVAAGRRASDLSRRNDPGARREWARSSVLWERVGDDRRAHLARQYAGATMKPVRATGSG